VHTAATKNSIALLRINAVVSTRVKEPVMGSVSMSSLALEVIVRVPLDADARLSLVSTRREPLVLAPIRMLPLAAGCGLEL